MHCNLRSSVTYIILSTIVADRLNTIFTNFVSTDIQSIQKIMSIKDVNDPLKIYYNNHNIVPCTQLATKLIYPLAILSILMRKICLRRELTPTNPGRCLRNDQFYWFSVFSWRCRLPVIYFSEVHSNYYKNESYRKLNTKSFSKYSTRLLWNMNRYLLKCKVKKSVLSRLRHDTFFLCSYIKLLYSYMLKIVFYIAT